MTVNVNNHMKNVIMLILLSIISQYNTNVNVCQKMREVRILKELYTIPEAAQALGIKPRTVREWLRKGTIKARRTAENGKGIILIPESEIKEVATRLPLY